MYSYWYMMPLALHHTHQTINQPHYVAIRDGFIISFDRRLAMDTKPPDRNTCLERCDKLATQQSGIKRRWCRSEYALLYTPCLTGSLMGLRFVFSCAAGGQ